MLYSSGNSFGVTEANKMRRFWGNASAPANPVEGEIWLDLSISTQFHLKRYSGSAWVTMVCNELADRTISLTYDMTDETIQALLDNIGFINYGVTITVQFGDGVYASLTSAIEIRGIDGAGYLHIKGNTGDSSMSTTRSVDLDNDATGAYSIQIEHCSCKITIEYMKFRVDSTAGAKGIDVLECKGRTRVHECYFLGDAQDFDGSAGVSGRNCSGTIHVEQCNFSQNNYGVQANDCSHVIVEDCADVGTMPKTGIWTSQGNVHSDCTIDGFNADNYQLVAEIY